MEATKGAFITFPSGIEHRFAVDENLYIQAMRLFPGSAAPDWSSVPRSEIHGNNTARNAYVDAFLCGIDPDTDHHHHHSEDDDSDDHHQGHSEGDASDDSGGVNGRCRGSFVVPAMVAGLAFLA